MDALNLKVWIDILTVNNTAVLYILSLWHHDHHHLVVRQLLEKISVLPELVEGEALVGT